MMLPSGLLYREVINLQSDLKQAPLALLDSLDNILVLNLEPVRSIGGSGLPIHRLTMQANQHWLLLGLEISPPYVENYNVVLFDEHKIILWQKKNLKINNLEQLNMILPTNIFSHGDTTNNNYFVSVNDSNANTNLRANFSFQISRDIQ